MKHYQPYKFIECPICKKKYLLLAEENAYFKTKFVCDCGSPIAIERYFIGERKIEAYSFQKDEPNIQFIHGMMKQFANGRCEIFFFKDLNGSHEVKIWDSTLKELEENENKNKTPIIGNLPIGENTHWCILLLSEKEKGQ